MHSQDLSAKSLSGGARIRAVFNELFAPALRDMSPVRDVSDDAILTVIKNGAGVAGACALTLLQVLHCCFCLSPACGMWHSHVVQAWLVGDACWFACVRPCLHSCFLPRLCSACVLVVPGQLPGVTRHCN